MIKIIFHILTTTHRSERLFRAPRPGPRTARPTDGLPRELPTRSRVRSRLKKTSRVCRSRDYVLVAVRAPDHHGLGVGDLAGGDGDGLGDLSLLGDSGHDDYYSCQRVSFSDREGFDCERPWPLVCESNPRYPRQWVLKGKDPPLYLSVRDSSFSFYHAFEIWKSQVETPHARRRPILFLRLIHNEACFRVRANI